MLSEVMMGNVITWLAIGLGAGLVVNFIFLNHKGYFTGTILAGIVGSFVGGMVYTALKLGRIAGAIDPISFLVAFFGAVILLFLIGMLVLSENKADKKINTF